MAQLRQNRRLEESHAVRCKPLDLPSTRFDAFVQGGADEAEEFFGNKTWNKSKPVHCLSTRFGGVNYHVSILISNASRVSTESRVSSGYTAMYNPNYYNKFTIRRDDESEEHVKSRTNGRWLLSFWKALEHTERTGGYLVQPLQVDHEDGPYSDMQKVEKMMAKRMGIRVLEFEFKETEVSEMDIKHEIVEKRDETAFTQRMWDFLLEHGIANDMPEVRDEDEEEEEEEESSSCSSSSS